MKTESDGSLIYTYYPQREVPDPAGARWKPAYNEMKYGGVCN